MAKITTQIIIEAVDQASGALGKINKSIDAMQPAFQKMSLVGTAALGAIGGIAYKAIKDYQGVELANKQLETAVISVSKGTRAQVEAINDICDALERKGVIDGDSLKIGAAQLSTFGLTTDMVTKLTPALADLTVNQFGVNASAEQFNQSANVMAKALNGQFGILEKSGIRFTDLQQKMIKTGTDAERAAALTEGLNQNLKLTNESARQTSAGFEQHLNVQLGNISENIGSALLPALANLMDKIAPVIEKVSDWTAKNPELTIRIIEVSAAIAAFVAAAGILGMTLPAIIAGASALGTAFVFLAGLISWPVIAIGLLIAAGVMLYRHWDDVKLKAQQIWDGIKMAIKIVVDLIVGIVDLAFSKIGINIGARMTEIKTAISIVWEGIKSIWGAATGWISDTSKTWGEGLKGIIEPIISWISEKFSWISSTFNSISSMASKIGSSVGSAATNLVNRGSKLTGFAEGGIVTRPTIAMVGEGGEPEAIIPFSKMGGMMRGGGITINMSGNTFLDERAAEKMGQLLINRLTSQIRV